jgi:hypothetical protein
VGRQVWDGEKGKKWAMGRFEFGWGFGLFSLSYLYFFSLFLFQSTPKLI